MGSHELLELILLLLFVGRGQAGLLLSLIVHHFLNDAASVTIQVRQLRVLWLHLLSVDLDITLNDGTPPLLLVFLSKTELEDAITVSESLKTPDAVALLDGLVQVTIDKQRLALNSNLEVRLGDVHSQHL